MATCENTWGEDECFSCGSLSESEPCGKPAVIRYDGRNLCKDCADPNVLKLLVTAKHARVFVNSRERIKRPEGIDLYDAAIAALAPKGD